MKGSLGRESAGIVMDSSVEAVLATTTIRVVATGESAVRSFAQGRTIRRSEIGGMNHRCPWSGPRGQPRRFGVSGSNVPRTRSKPSSRAGEARVHMKKWSMAESDRTYRA